MAHTINSHGGPTEGLELASVLADGFVCGASEVVADDAGWGWPRRFDESQLRVLCSCMAWRPGAYRQLAQTTAGVCVRLATDAAHVALEVRVRQAPPVVQAMREQLAPRERADNDAVAPAQVSCVVDGRSLGLMTVDGDLVRLSLADPKKDPGMGIVALPGLGERHEVSIWLPCDVACGIRELWADGTYVEPVLAQGRLLVLGDSVSQGLMCDDPADAWPTVVSQALGLELVNQSVGLQVFQPTAASSATADGVEQVIVQLGGAYRAYARQGLNAFVIERDIRTFFLELAHACPGARIWAITPFAYAGEDEAAYDEPPLDDAPWHDEESARYREALRGIVSMIRTSAEAVGARVLEGDALCDVGDVVLAGNAEILRAAGHTRLAERLLAALRKAKRDGRKVSKA